MVEHPFHILKNRFRHNKLRYRGLKKNTAQLHALFALANLVIVKEALANGRLTAKNDDPAHLPAFLSLTRRQGPLLSR